jgi:hypothetical protein
MKHGKSGWKNPGYVYYNTRHFTGSLICSNNVVDGVNNLPVSFNGFKKSAGLYVKEHNPVLGFSPFISLADRKFRKRYLAPGFL